MLDLDIFGKGFSFFMNGHRSIKTLAGFFFTVLATVAIVCSCVIFYAAMQDTTLPTIKTEVVALEESPTIRLVDDVFLFISLVNYRTIIPTGFLPVFNRIEAVMTYEEVRNDPFPNMNDNVKTTQTVKIPMVQCNKTTGWNKHKPMLTELHLSTIMFASWCFPDPTPSNPFSLQSFRGRINADVKMQIKIYPCALQAGCLPYEKKKDLLYVIGFLESGYNGQDFKKPIVHMLNLFHRYTPYEGFHKTYRVQIGEFISRTQTSSISSTTTIDKGYSIGAKETPSIEPHGGTAADPLVTIEIEASPIQVTYSRSYGSLVEFISNLGGMTQIALSLAALLYSFYSNYVYKRDLIVRGVMNISNESGSKGSNSKISPSTSLNSKKTLGGITKSKTIKSTYTNFWRYLLPGVKSSKPKPRDNSLESIDEFRRVKYWMECEKSLDRAIDVYKILPMLNELTILRKVVFKDYHSRLSPRVGGIILREQPSNDLETDFEARAEEWIAHQEMESKSENFSPLAEFRLSLAKKVLKDYRKYHEREEAEFSMFSGIKGLMEANHMLNHLVKPDERGQAIDNKTNAIKPSSSMQRIQSSNSLSPNAQMSKKNGPLKPKKAGPRKVFENAGIDSDAKMNEKEKLNKKPRVQKIGNTGFAENMSQKPRER